MKVDIDDLIIFIVCVLLIILLIFTGVYIGVIKVY